MLFIALHASATEIYDMLAACPETVQKLWIIMIVSTWITIEKLIYVSRIYLRKSFSGDCFS